MPLNYGDTRIRIIGAKICFLYFPAILRISMYDLHANNRLRNFSISDANGRRKVTSSDIRNMSEEEYQELRSSVRRRVLSQGNTLASKRQLKELLRKLTIARKERTRQFNLNFHFTKKESVVLDSFYPERQRGNVWKPYKKRRRNITDINLNTFSFIDYPEETVQKFSEIAEAECLSKEVHLNFNDSMCYDMGPYLVLALIKNDLPKQHLQRGLITEEVTQVLDSVGLLDYMNIVPQRPKVQVKPAANDQLFEELAPPNVLDDVMPFNLRSGGGIDAKNLAESEQRDEKVAQDFLNTLRKWIQKHNPKQVISEEMGSQICSVMTELFDNALRHSDPKTEAGQWHTVGVLQKRKDKMGRDIVVCNIAILNIGKTIAETLDQAPENVLEGINSYIELHKNKFETDTLKTVCALQDKVSRVHPQKGNATLNGVGLMTSIMTVFSPLFVSNLPQYEPSFTLLSGRSWISATLPYIKDSGEYGKRQLAFNGDNDLNLPPDAECVKTLSRAFPGTIVSLRFVIGADKLKKLNEND